ncbi:hypothetical protein SELMODRAFT_408999 [Selaginella moellendorffii]|uniref:C2 domain-containing protein n=2 Tax=Selaginella moellendorffii TaxID=88036 RepID=D8R945_SELML|nr:hypothetical protein SELMODRAFT_408999 [Selaginella moellendorffii]
MKLIAKSSSSLSISSSKDRVSPGKEKQQKSNNRKSKQPRTRAIEFCIISAQDLKSATKFGRMRSYAVASIYPDRKVSTRIDCEGGTNPTWDAKLVLEVDERVLVGDEDDTHTQLTIDIFSRGSLRDKLVGTVRILVCDAVRGERNMRSIVNRFPVASYLVFRPGGCPQGILNVCIPPGGRFPERFDSISFKRGEDLRVMASSLKPEEILSPPPDHTEEILAPSPDHTSSSSSTSTSMAESSSCSTSTTAGSSSSSLGEEHHV